jgi:D-psicose/D-tagatose/L-ribulose 3-epimerase
MNFGINTFLFVSPFTGRTLSILKKVKAWGYDSVEIAVEDPAHFDPAKVKAELDKLGLQSPSVCAVYGPDRDLRGNSRQQTTAKTYIKKLIDHTVALGGNVVVGPHYSAVGRRNLHPASERKAQWKTVAANLKEVCDYAAEQGVSLALEPLNRFETDFINTCEQALEMIDRVGSPALKVHLDTFHMNIEEKDSAKAILNAGKQLAHLHACGCDRGQPGNDHIDWVGIAAALKKIKYDRAVVIETFSTEIKMIATAAAIWRAFEPSQEDLGVKGLKFLKQTLK